MQSGIEGREIRQATLGIEKLSLQKREEDVTSVNPKII